ncbi:MAG: hypothetical protein JKY10_05075 [Cohaesibacteraceae bacterium]|nr:hypothetical protein [Cohaesibacteraceae bacterium]
MVFCEMGTDDYFNEKQKSLNEIADEIDDKAVRVIDELIRNMDFTSDHQGQVASYTHHDPELLELAFKISAVPTS